MDKFIIRGGAPLAGAAVISGAKNAALPILFSSLLTDEPCVYDNVPDLRDIASTLTALAIVGATHSRRRNRVTLHTPRIAESRLPYDLVRTMRASVLALGPLIARAGAAAIALPGGCAIGARPVDIHIAALRQMGADIHIADGNIVASLPGGRRLRGADIALPFPSVTATENLMMASALADGDTRIRNAACEPEVRDLADCLRAMGATISGDGTSDIIARGAKRLAGARHTVMPDRIEAGTYIAAVAACGGDVLLAGARADDMRGVLQVFSRMGVAVSAESGGIRVRRPARVRPAAADATTAPYPGYPTDMQAQLIAANCVANGRAFVTETIFENRFMHIPELARMGARIELQNNTAIITGARQLRAAPVMATDLRASASLVIGALAAEGETEISRIYHLDRGYEKLDQKLRKLGAKVRRRGRAMSAQADGGV